MKCVALCSFFTLQFSLLIEYSLKESDKKIKNILFFLPQKFSDFSCEKPNSVGDLCQQYSLVIYPIRDLKFNKINIF